MSGWAVLALFGGGDFGAEGLVFLGEGAELFVLGRGFVGELFELGESLGGGGGDGDAGFVEAGFGLGAGVGLAGVGAGEPVGEVEEFADGGEGVGFGDGFGGVDGDVAEVFDGFDFGDEGGAGELLELGVEDVGGEVVAVGRGEPGVVAVDPVDGEFEGAAGVEAGGAGIGVEEGFGFGGGDVDFGPLGGEVLEVGGAGHLGVVSWSAGGRTVAG